MKYSGWFEQNGYKFLAEGLVHNVYEKEGYIYKIVKENRFQLRSRDHFEKEKKVLEFLYQKGIPVVKVEKIYQVGELIEDYPVLCEKKIMNQVYNEAEISCKCVNEIIGFLENTSRICAPGFGALYGKREYEYNTWDDFLTSEINKAVIVKELIGNKEEFAAKLLEYVICNRGVMTYSDVPRFLIMDPNPNNFFFEKEQLSVAIDIDHPIGGDPLWQWACVYWHKPAWIENMIKMGVLHINMMKKVITYTALIGLASIAFLIENTGAYDCFSKERGNQLLMLISTRADYTTDYRDVR